MSLSYFSIWSICQKENYCFVCIAWKINFQSFITSRMFNAACRNVKPRMFRIRCLRHAWRSEHALQIENFLQSNEGHFHLLATSFTKAANKNLARSSFSTLMKFTLPDQSCLAPFTTHNQCTFPGMVLGIERPANRIWLQVHWLESQVQNCSLVWQLKGETTSCYFSACNVRWSHLWQSQRPCNKQAA